MLPPGHIRLGEERGDTEYGYRNRTPVRDFHVVNVDAAEDYQQ